MDVFNWTCPYCRHPQVVSEHNISTNMGMFVIGENATGVDIGYSSTAIACQNKACKKVYLNFTLLKDRHYAQGSRQQGSLVQHWQLLPESSAKPQPDFIPKPLRDDYLEACRIRDLSPKASAALARRCLQGMIRDFTGIAKGSLDAEIKELEQQVREDKAPRSVSPESVEAIDHARKIGNIGAHMEKDINLIVEIDPGEAQILIELVETLFDEWYVERDTRARRFKGIAELRAKKDAEKAGK